MRARERGDNQRVDARRRQATGRFSPTADCLLRTDQERTQADVHWVTRAKPIDLPNAYRIRHSLRGRHHEGVRLSAANCTISRVYRGTRTTDKIMVRLHAKPTSRHSACSMAMTPGDDSCETETKAIWTEKPWGRTRELSRSTSWSRHELQVEPRGFCSIHYHQHQANRFLVHSGKIAVLLFFAGKTERFVLAASDQLDVPSLIVHQFHVIEGGTVVEEYWPDRGGKLSAGDIIRLTASGWEKGA